MGNTHEGIFTRNKGNDQLPIRCRVVAGTRILIAQVERALRQGASLLQRVQCCTGRITAGLISKLRCAKGQGTTEYAILVGVLVVIAIIAITVFRPKLEELWNAISTGINSL